MQFKRSQPSDYVDIEDEVINMTFRNDYNMFLLAKPCTPTNVRSFTNI